MPRHHRSLLVCLLCFLVTSTWAVCPHDTCNAARLRPSDPTAGNNVVADFERVMSGVLMALSATPTVGPLAFLGIGLLQVAQVYQGGPNPYAVYRNQLVAAQDYLACQMAAYTADLEIFVQGQFTDQALASFSDQLSNIQNQIVDLCPIMNCLNYTTIPYSKRPLKCVQLLDDAPNSACKPYEWDPRGTIPTCHSGLDNGLCDPLDRRCYADPYTIPSIKKRLLDIKTIFDTSDAIKGMHALDQYTDMRAVIAYAKGSTIYFHLLTTLVMLGDNDSLGTINRRANEFASFLQAAIAWHTNTSNIMPVTAAASSQSWSEGPLYVRANCDTNAYTAMWDVQPGWPMPFQGIYCFRGRYIDAFANPPTWVCPDGGLSYFFSGSGREPDGSEFGYSRKAPDEFCGDPQSSDCLFLLQVTGGTGNQTLPGLCAQLPECQQFTNSGALFPLVPPDNCSPVPWAWGEAQINYGAGACNAEVSMLSNSAYTQCFNCYRDAKVTTLIRADKFVAVENDDISGPILTAPLVGTLPALTDPQLAYLLDRSGTVGYTVDSFKGLLQRGVQHFADLNMQLFEQTNLTRMVDNYRKLANTSFDGWFGIYNFKLGPHNYYPLMPCSNTSLSDARRHMG